MGYSPDYEAKSDHPMSPCSAALRPTGFSLGMKVDTWKGRKMIGIERGA
jgi:hypothetical protein